MSGITGVVYDPPKAGFPPLAVVFHDGKVIGAEPVPNVQTGEAFMKAVLEQFAADLAAGKLK